MYAVKEFYMVLKAYNGRKNAHLYSGMLKIYSGSNNKKGGIATKSADAYRAEGISWVKCLFCVLCFPIT